MATRPQDQREEGPGTADPEHINDAPEIAFEEDKAIERGHEADPEVRHVTPGPEITQPLDPAT